MNDTIPISLASSSQGNEIILYQPDSTVRLEVRLENETDEKSNVHFLHIRHTN